MKDTHRGHKIIETKPGIWVYKDTQLLVSISPNRSCGYCGKENTSSGHDGCLGTLPQVVNACCGHGAQRDAYVQYFDKSIVRGAQARGYFNLHISDVKM